MLIKLNSKNLFIFLLISAFLYLAYLIWTAKESFPAIDVELRDLVSYIALAVETGGHAVSRIYAEKSGDGGMEIYGKGQMDVGRAELLTRADLISNSLMLGLLRRFPLLRVVSEEKSNIGEQELAKYRSDNYELWMGLREVLSKLPTWRVPLNRIVIWIDPLDATQEFTEGLTEYVTVMACIAVDGKPFIGAIYSPFKGEIVLGMVDYGLVSSRDGKIKNNLRAASSGNRTVLVSRSHAGNVSKLVERTFGTESPGYVVEPAGGAGYKTLRLIRQTADLYVHTTAIKKWDICAGDALIRAGGGALLSLADGLPIDYSIKWEEEQNAKDGPTKNNHKVHSGGMLMALESPFSIYEQLKKHLN